MRRLTRDFFNRPTLRVARALLGKVLVRVGGLSARVTEVEAYIGPADRACHGYGGRRTPRLESLYADGGVAYVYLIYGLHWMLNVSTAGAGRPEAVLIRGIEGFDGPGRVARALKIDGRFDGEDLCASERLWLEDRGGRAGRVVAGPRVGIDYAGRYWASRPWRFRLG